MNGKVPGAPRLHEISNKEAGSLSTIRPSLFDQKPRGLEAATAKAQGAAEAAAADAGEATTKAAAANAANAATDAGEAAAAEAATKAQPAAAKPQAATAEAAAKAATKA